MHSRIILIIGPPRSGTTLLMRMLNAHSQIYSRPEPHLLGPLAHLGYYDTVEKAPFDQFQAAQAVRELVADLPAGERDYLDACRAYVETIYGRLLATKGGNRRYFVDKTPANALVLPFVAKVLPEAKYIVLTRHPAAVFSSYANSFFAGDYHAAQRFNPILSRYIPAIGWLLRERPVPLLHLTYEALVSQPEREMNGVCRFLELDFEPAMIDYGAHRVDGAGLGDPLTVDRETRPVTSSVEKWVGELADSPSKLAVIQEMLAVVDDRDLATWGFGRANLWTPLANATPGRTDPAVRVDRFLLQRRLLRWLRRDVQSSTIGKVARKVRDLCDIVLRG